MTQKFRLSHELLDLQASDVAYLLRNFSPNATVVYLRLLEVHKDGFRWDYERQREDRASFISFNPVDVCETLNISLAVLEQALKELQDKEALTISPRPGSELWVIFPFPDEATIRDFQIDQLVAERQEQEQVRLQIEEMSARYVSPAEARKANPDAYCKGTRRDGGACESIFPKYDGFCHTHRPVGGAPTPE